MKKLTVIFGVAIALLIAAALALPFWFGMKTERGYERLVQEFGQRAGAQLQNTKYERGWVRSTAETVVRYPGLPLQIKLAHEIHHGPFEIDRLLDGQFDSALVQARIKTRVQLVLRREAGQTEAPSTLKFPPMTADTVIALNGDGDFRAELPAKKQTGEEQPAIEWSAVSATMRFDREWKKFQINVQAPRIAMAGTGGATPRPVTLSGIAFRSDLHEGVAGYFFGNSSLAIKQVKIDPVMVADGMRFVAVARPAGDNVNLKFTYGIKQVGVADRRFGPGQLTVEARRLDAAMLKKFENELNTIYTKDLPEEQATLLILGRLLELVSGLAKKAPELEITRLSVKIDGHEISGKGKLVLDGSKADLSENPMLLLTALRGEAELTVPAATLKSMLAPLIQRDIMESAQRGELNPEELAQLNPEAMSRIVDQALPLYLARNDFGRLLVPVSDQYKVTAVFKRGQLLVNDEPWRGPSVKLP